MDTQKEETWRDIPGYEGHYQVSDIGRVRSLKQRGSGTNLLSPSPGYGGHLGVTLCLNGKPTRVMVHKLVLLTFVGPKPEGCEACHGPLGNLVNTPSNLRWDTKSENMKDKMRHGTQPRGEGTGRAILTEGQVRAIRESTLKNVELAEIYKVSAPTISAIRTRRSWSHI